MSITEARQSVRFVFGYDGKQTDALLSIDAWDTLIQRPEDLGDPFADL